LFPRGNALPVGSDLAAAAGVRATKRTREQPQTKTPHTAPKTTVIPSEVEG